MDPNSSYTEMDSFALQLQESVEAYKENFEKATKEERDIACSLQTLHSFANTETATGNGKVLANANTIPQDDVRKRPGLKDRLRELTVKINEQMQDEESLKDAKKRSTIHLATGMGKTKTFGFMPKSSVNSLNLPQSPRQIIMKGSVAHLRRNFERDTAGGDTVMAAPELLSVREKAKLFELKCLQEEAARDQQYYPVHSRSQYDKRFISSSDDAIQYEEDVQLEETVQQGTSTSNEEVNNWIQSLKMEDDQFGASINEDDGGGNENEEYDGQAAIECVDKVFETIHNMDDTHANDELIFTSLDIIETAPKQFLVNLSPNSSLASEQEDVVPIPCSSTRSNASLSVSNSSMLSTWGSTDNRLCPYDSQDEHPETPQLKTLSYYRLQQKMEKAQLNSPTNQDNAASHVLYKRQQLSQEPQSCDSFIQACNDKINKLNQEISECKQILAQAGKALRLSLSSSDTIRSDARVEADRLLLISDYHIYLAVVEIRRLEAMAREPNKYCTTNPTKGLLSFFKIKVPLQRDFVVQRSRDKMQSIHHFLCLISYRSKVECSKAINAAANLSSGHLEFCFAFTTGELDANFKVTIKLFELEFLKNEKPKKHSTLSIRWKPSDASNIVRGVSSASSDNMSTNFKEVGEVTLTLDNVCNMPKFFTFSSLSSLLQGIMTMELKLKVIYENHFEGFFDYQDIESKFWNLRWFVIDGPSLMYWRFKEDFATKSQPMGEVNLKHCINPTVCLLKPEFRHLCARHNTIVLVTMQSEKVSNATKLVTGGVIRKPKPQLHFLSSASREEIIELCDSLNEILHNLRTWEAGRVVPKYSPEEFDRLLLSAV